MASSKGMTTHRRSGSKSELSCTYSTVDSLPIRTATGPTQIRPIPAAILSSHSASSTSSFESSESTFDCTTLEVRAESPTTPLDELMIDSDDRERKASEDIEQEETPLLKGRRKPRRPPLVPTAEHQSRRAGTDTFTHRIDQAPPRRSVPPPQFKPLVRSNEVIRPKSLSLHDTEVNRPLPLLDDDLFADSHASDHASNIEQDNGQGPTPHEGSDEDSAEDDPSSNHEGLRKRSRTSLELERSIQDSEQEDELSELEDNDTEPNNARTPSSNSNNEPKNTHTPSNRLRFSRYRIEEKDSCSINESLIKTMKKPRKPEISPGWTYIYESPNLPGHVKIGNTTNMTERESSLKRCERDLILVKDDDRNAFDFHPIVEALVHTELHNRRRRLLCRCGRRHKEYFEVEKEVALRSTCRWRTWVKVQRPYDRQWKLTPYWQWKVRNLPKKLADVEWDEWTRPSRLEYLKYWYEEFGKDHCAVLDRHFRRKDKRFWFVGMLLLFCMYLLFGGACAAWLLFGLIIL